MKSFSFFLLTQLFGTTGLFILITAKKDEMIFSQQLKSKPKTDRIGNTYERYEQIINGIPVYGSAKVVTTLSNGTERSKDNFWTNVNQNLSDTLPRITMEEAKSIAADYVENATNHKVATIAMNKNDDGVEIKLYLARMNEKDYLVYRIQFYQERGGIPLMPPSPIDGSSIGGSFSMPLVFVDAHSGEVLDWFDNLQS